MASLREIIFGKQYSYYDSPEGEDCLKKLGAVTQLCGFYGVMYSTLDVMMLSHPKGYPQIFSRYAYLTLPFMGMGAAFVSTSCISTNLRKKDDIWNYFFGGAAAGALAGAVKNSLKVGSYASLCLGAAAALRKDLYDRGYNLLGPVDVNRKTVSHRMLARDYTIYEDPGKA